MISVQRLDDLMVPRFFWFDFSTRCSTGCQMSGRHEGRG